MLHILQNLEENMNIMKRRFYFILFYVNSGKIQCLKFKIHCVKLTTETVEDKTNEPEDIATDTIKTEASQKKRPKKKKNQSSLSDLQDIIKLSNIHIIRVPEEEDRGGTIKNYLKGRLGG